MDMVEEMVFKLVFVIVLIMGLMKDKLLKIVVYYKKVFDKE